MSELKKIASKLLKDKQVICCLQDSTTNIIYFAYVDNKQIYTGQLNPDGDYILKHDICCLCPSSTYNKK